MADCTHQRTYFDRSICPAAIEASADRYNLADEWAFRKASMIVREFGTEA